MSWKSPESEAQASVAKRCADAWRELGLREQQWALQWMWKSSWLRAPCSAVLCEYAMKGVGASTRLHASCHFADIGASMLAVHVACL